MKLVTYHHTDGWRLGAVVGPTVVDLQAAHAGCPGDLLPVSSETGDFPADMLSYLEQGPATWEAARAVVEWVRGSALAGPAGSTGADFLLDLSDADIGPPIPNPRKVIGIGLNYADHAREQNVKPPERPIVFVKFSTSVIGPGQAITWPDGASLKVDYEAELAVVIGRPARQVSAAEAYDFIAGYTIANDVSARDVQLFDGQWVRGKSFDTFCPLGPYLLTTDEVADPHRLEIFCRVNGEVRQHSNTDQLIFNIPSLIEFLSRTSTLLPGDVILTGTPHGVGVFRDPPVFLKSGDVVEVEIEGLGRLSNPVR